MQQKPFLFGASTSAHQVEGGSRNNDWWEWEQKRPSDLRSGKAADSWNRYWEDVLLAQELGHTAHRLSLEWSRIEPEEGKFNRAAIDHYRAILQELCSRNMKTFVTLHHFTNPTWLARKGGWEGKRTPELFERYTKYVAQHLGDSVDFWITINEPNIYSYKSYLEGTWPPQRKSVWTMIRVFLNMARAHQKAYRVLHSVLSHPHVGIAHNCIAKLPVVKDFLMNHSFLFLTRNTHDFIGVNYYFANQAPSWKGATSDMGWPVSPEGLTQVLLSLKKYKKPIYVTENGIADASDTKRAEFIRSHIRAIEDAQMQGCDVRGYLHWSLIDNFEWAEGFTPRFGLIEVDYTTMKRTIRPSAYVYKAIIEQSKSMVS